MFTKTYDIIRTFVYHFFLAKRSAVKGANRLYIFRLLSGLYVKALLNPHKDKVIRYRILKYDVSAYGYGDLLYLFKEIFLRHDYYFETENTHPKIMDCGANIGMSVLYFKFLYPDSSIVAFEPNPFAFDLLKKNISQNNLAGVRIEHTALSNKKGTVDFFIGKNKGSLLGSIVEQNPGDSVINVRVSKLSDFIQDDNFDFIKIDIEGAESHVIKDLVETDKVSRAGKYTIEYHHKMQAFNSRLAEFLEPFERLGFGYRLNANMDTMEESQNILIKLFREKSSRH